MALHVGGTAPQSPARRVRGNRSRQARGKKQNIMMSNAHPTFARSDRDGLARIGATRHDVVGIRFFNDDNGAAGGEQQQGQEGQQQDGNQAPPWGDDPTKFDPNKAWNLIQNLRKDAENRQAKTDAAIAAAAEKAKKDTLAEFGRLLTGEQAPETDPAKLNEALTQLKSTVTEKDTALQEAQKQAKSTQVALQVAIHAPTLGGNTALLLANEQFKTSIASVEPTDEAAIKAAITKALQENAALKQPPARSGDGEHTGPTVQSLEAQLTAAKESKDMAEVIRLTREIAFAKKRQA